MSYVKKSSPVKVQFPLYCTTNPASEIIHPPSGVANIEYISVRSTGNVMLKAKGPLNALVFSPVGAFALSPDIHVRAG
jgi:hypothetical protein